MDLLKRVAVVKYAHPGRLGERIVRYISIVSRFPCAAAARVSIQMKHPAALAAVTSKLSIEHLAHSENEARCRRAAPQIHFLPSPH